MNEIRLYVSADTKYSTKCAWGVILEYKGNRSKTHCNIIKGNLPEDELEVCAIIYGMGKIKDKTVPLKIVTNCDSLIEWQRKINVSNKSLAYKDTRKEFQLHGELYKYRDWLLDKMGQFNGVEIVSWEKLEQPHIDRDSILENIYDINF